jgi:hypothetical protein
MKFHTVLYKKSSCKCEFHENQYNESHMLLRTLMKFGHIFYIFYPIWIKFGAQDVHRYLMVDYEFCENQHSDSHTFHSGINKFTSVLSVLFCLCTIWYMGYEGDAVQHF